MKRLFFPTLLFVLALPLAAQWRRAGLYGADVRSLAIDPASPDRIVIGTSAGEVYVSTTGGLTWSDPRGSIPFPEYVVDNLAFDAKGRLWAACWGLWGGGAIAVSADGGRNWERRDAGLENFSVRALAIDPRDAHHLVAGGLTGIHETFDGGATWTKIGDKVNVESLAIDPRCSTRIYAGTWRLAWRTDDGGASWKQINDGMVPDTDVFTFTIDPSGPDNVWISTCGWVYNSKNRGDLWTRHRDGFDNRRIHDVKLDPADAARVYAGSVAGLYRTSDNGSSWKRITDPSLVVNAIGVTAERPDRIILATEGDGIYVSMDRGETFLRSSEGLYNVRTTAVVPDPDTPARLYAAVVSGNAASGIYQSDDGGARWKTLSETRIPDVLSLVVQKSVGARFVAGTEKGFYWSDDGSTWNWAEPLLVPVRVEKILRYNDQRMFAGTSEGVFTSRDGGKSWCRLRGANGKTIDIATGARNGKPALYALTSRGLGVFDGVTWTCVTGVPDRSRSVAVRQAGGADIVIVGTATGVRAGTIDEGVWSPLDESSDVARSLREASAIDRAILAVHESRLAPSSESESWRRLALPVPEKAISSIAADPHGGGRIYVATNGAGIFVAGAEAAEPESRLGTPR